MTPAQLKAVITKELDQLPESALSEVLNYLKELHQKHAEEIEFEKFWEQTLIEDQNLLRRLAQ